MILHECFDCFVREVHGIALDLDALNLPCSHPSVQSGSADAESGCRFG
jgi:hypothetical protein